MPPVASDSDRALVEELLAGDRDAFARLIDLLYPPMARLAALILGDATHVPDAIQETWVAVLGGLHAFEGRASLKTWVLRILVNRSRTLAERLGRRRLVPLDESELDRDEPEVDPARFGRFGTWRDPPRPWSHGCQPEAALLRKELGALLAEELERLPPKQRAVVILRDVEELGADEVCEILGLSEANQRVLLHRGRARLRSAIELRLERA